MHRAGNIPGKSDTRPYRGALSRDVALAHLIGEAGRTLDADVVAALLELVHLDAGDAA